MKLLIAGGGTGGHVFPAIAIAREWMSRGMEREVVLVGTQRGIEMKLVPQAGFPLETLRAAGLKGKGGLTLVKNFATLAPGMLDAFAILRKHKPVAAFGVGGYAAGPMMLATWLRGIPNVIFEPNAEPGFTNKVLVKLSRRVATGYGVTAKALGSKAIVTGNPVRAEFFDSAPREPEKPFRLLITGGSQGALPINRAFVDAMDLLAARKDELSVVHQTGERDYNAVRTAYARREFCAEVVPFLGNMSERFAWADLIVCRAGAITAAEVTNSATHRKWSTPTRVGSSPSQSSLPGALQAKFSRCSTIPGRSNCWLHGRVRSQNQTPRAISSTLLKRSLTCP